MIKLWKTIKKMLGKFWWDKVRFKILQKHILKFHRWRLIIMEKLCVLMGQKYSVRQDSWWIMSLKLGYQNINQTIKEFRALMLLLKLKILMIKQRIFSTRFSLQSKDHLLKEVGKLYLMGTKKMKNQKLRFKMI